MTTHKLPQTLGAKLTAALGLSEYTIGFNLRVRVNQIPTIIVRSYVQPFEIDDQDDLVQILKRYELKEIPEQTEGAKC